MKRTSATQQTFLATDSQELSRSAATESESGDSSSLTKWCDKSDGYLSSCSSPGSRRETASLLGRPRVMGSLIRQHSTLEPQQALASPIQRIRGSVQPAFGCNCPLLARGREIHVHQSVCATRGWSTLTSNTANFFLLQNTVENPMACLQMELA